MSIRKVNNLPVPSQQNGITRRDALKTAAAVGTTAALASSLPLNSVLAATPKKGGHLKMGISDGNTTDSLDTTTYVTVYLFTRRVLSGGMGSSDWTTA